MKKILVLFFVLIFTVSGVNAKSKSKYRDYRPYMGELKNEVLETKTVTKNNITIVRKKLKPMTYVRVYGMLYEYWIYNKTGKDITIVNVDSKDRITLAGAWGRSNIPTGNFSIVKGVKTDVEKNRFVKRPPENETIEKDDSMRVLLMSQKSTAHKATFNFEVNGKNVSITVQ